MRRDRRETVRTSSARRGALAAAGLGLALVLAACSGGGSGGDAATVAPGTEVRLATGADGTFLTDADGASLYLFTPDSPGVSTCTGGCLTAWPPLLTEGQPVAADGLDDAVLGTLTRDDGSLQVTARGLPLYRFAGDRAAGDTNGQGADGLWFLVAPDGSLIAPTPAPAADAGMGGAPADNDGY